MSPDHEPAQSVSAIKTDLSQMTKEELQAACEEFACITLKVSLWSALAGFLLGASAATVLTLAYFGASN